MKFLIFLVFIGGVLSNPLSGPTDDLPRSESEKIAFATAIKKGENLDFCTLTSTFFQKTQTCGCSVVDKQWVLTSGRCLADPQEGKATNVTVSIVALDNKPRLTCKIVIPDGTNGKEVMGMTMTDTIAAPGYDFAADIPFKAIGINNVGLVKLCTPIADKDLTDPKKFKVADWASSTATSEVYTAWTAVFPATSYSYRTCGIGFIDNFNTKPKTAQCADLNLVDIATCKTSLNPEPVLPDMKDNAFCLQGSSFTCGGDYGGPVWAYKLSSDGKSISEQKLFGITVGSPDVKQNSPCYGGQTTVAMFTPGLIERWVKAVIAGSYT